MKWRLFLFVAFACAGAGVALSANAAPPTGTTTVALPVDTATFKPGPGVENAERYCQICHTPAYVAMQPPFTSKQWTAEVTKMVKAYGAPIPADAIAPIAEYLTTEYGKP